MRERTWKTIIVILSVFLARCARFPGSFQVYLAVLTLYFSYDCAWLCLSNETLAGLRVFQDEDEEFCSYIPFAHFKGATTAMLAWGAL